MTDQGEKILEGLAGDSLEYVERQLNGLSIRELLTLMKMFQCPIERLTDKVYHYKNLGRAKVI